MPILELFLASIIVMIVFLLALLLLRLLLLGCRSFPHFFKKRFLYTIIPLSDGILKQRESAAYKELFIAELIRTRLLRL